MVVTPFYAGLLALLFLVLSARVSQEKVTLQHRQSSFVSIEYL